MIQIYVVGDPNLYVVNVIDIEHRVKLSCSISTNIDFLIWYFTDKFQQSSKKFNIMVFCCCEPFKCASILTGIELVLQTFDVYLSFTYVGIIQGKSGIDI